MIARRNLLPVLGAGLLLVACAAVRSASVPCYNGWISDGVEGYSKLWAPSDEALGKISQVLGDRGRIACIHQLPAGGLLVLSLKRGDVLTTEMTERDGKYVITDTGFVVSSRHK